MLLHDKLKGYKLILASQSPRRQFLLSELGFNFEVRLNGNTDETYPNNLQYNAIPVFLAQEKAKPFIADLAINEILITSDTIVWCNQQVIGKPANREQAISFLQTLSGNMHMVVTGVCLTSVLKSTTFSVETEVHFRKLEEFEIEFYVDTYKPYDKAGAYGVQEWIGYVGVERINGSYFNVMGLPVQRLYVELNKFLDEIAK
jgi:septum formation protein